MRGSLFFRIVSIVVCFSLAFSASAEGIHSMGSSALSWFKLLTQGEPPAFNEAPPAPAADFTNGRTDLRDGIWDTASLTDLGAIESSVQSQLNQSSGMPSVAV